MEDCKKYQIPAFGYWDFSDDHLPITQYFDSARNAGLLQYSGGDEESDLYGRELDNVLMSPPMIKGSSKPYHHQHVKEQKKHGRACDITEPPRQARAPKAVDGDLYKIPTEDLHEKPKRTKMSFLLRCLVMNCIA